MWDLDHKPLKNVCFLTVVLGKTLEGPLDCKEIKPAIPKGNQPWIFTGRTDAEAEALILWPPDAKSQLIGKDPDAGKNWRQEKWITEDKMVGWHHQFNGDEFEKAPGDGEGQGSLACCSMWSHKEWDMTEQLNWTEFLIKDCFLGGLVVKNHTGKTQRDRVEWEVRGGLGWRIHVYPWLIHVNVWQKPLQYCKVISLQLI